MESSPSSFLGDDDVVAVTAVAATLPPLASPSLSSPPTLGRMLRRASRILAAALSEMVGIVAAVLEALLPSLSTSQHEDALEEAPGLGLDSVLVPALSDVVRPGDVGKSGLRTASHGLEILG